MRAWGGVGTRVPLPAPIPVQICGQLPVPKPIPNNAGIYPPAMGIFCGCPLGLGLIAIPSENIKKQLKLNLYYKEKKEEALGSHILANYANPTTQPLVLPYKYHEAALGII